MMPWDEQRRRPSSSISKGPTRRSSSSASSRSRPRVNDTYVAFGASESWEDPSMKIPTPILAMVAAAGASTGIVLVVLVLLQPDKEIAAAVIAGTATVLGGSLSVAIGR